MAGNHPAATTHTELQLALRRCHGAFWYAALFSLCINLLTVLFSMYSLQVLDRVFNSRSYETLLMLSLLMGAAVIFVGFFSAIRSLVLDRAGAWLDQQLSPLLYSRSLRMAAIGAGAASQQQRDLASIRQFITSIGLTTLFDAPWSIIYLLAIFAVSVPLGWLCLCGCIILIGMGVLTELGTKKPLEHAQTANMQVLSFTESSSRQAETIEAMGMADTMLARWQGNFDKAQQWQHEAGQRAAMLQSITRTLRMGLQIGITGIGAYLALERQLTSGGMVASSILAARAFAPFENAIAFWKQFVTTRAAHARLNASVARQPAPRGEMRLPAPLGQLVVTQAAYQPAPNVKPILRNISFDVQPGESLGIAGPSGAGKSTLARLLTGVLSPSAGNVRLDGNEVSLWNRADLGGHIGYLPQHPDLFAGTISENIARMQPDAQPESVIHAAQIAGVHGLIQQLPMGYDTVWNPLQPAVSPGQKQRIALARAVYGEPQLVLLDEPNLHMDSEGEAALMALLQQLKLKRVTVIVVAHKPGLLQCMDKLLVVKNGMVEQFGPREQVMLAYARPAVATRQ